MKRIRILCSVGYYLPGYQSGGPVRTIANMVDHLGEEFDFRIVTKDRDALDTEPYAGVEIDGWNQVGSAWVFYASPALQTLRGWRKILAGTEYDLLYLNSFFSDRFTILPLVLRRLGLIPNRPSILAPRGEFSSGALELKAAKKRAFLRLARGLGLYRGLTWQASSEFERADIERVMGSAVERIIVAPNLSPKVVEDSGEESGRVFREPGPLRVVFLSRISPMKNLEFLLERIQNVEASVSLDIYGLRDGWKYWEGIQSLIEKASRDVPICFHGEVPPEKVYEVFAQHDLFVFPTLGENFGHVILESLMAGTPVLLSDRTLWKDSGDGGLQVLPLEDRHRWSSTIEEWARLSVEERIRRRRFARNIADSFLKKSNSVEANRELFLGAMRQDRAFS